MSETPAVAKPPLDEVMLAMDVVDTLRHRERVVERALSADAQDKELVARLKEIYAGQGIAVSDEILERGVKDLRENRFVYTPPAPGAGVTLARLYVSRGRWGKPLFLIVGVVAAVLIGYQLLVRGPAEARIAALPAELEQAYAAVVAESEAPAVETRADAARRDGQLALERDDYGAARAAIAALDGLHATLLQQYELHVVSRPGELSGVWRVPDANPGAQNYYLIVEAIDADGKRLTLPIRNEEDGKTYRVSRWGQRVDEATFRAVAADKQDDGIIQNDVVGVKQRGDLAPKYRAGVLGGAITKW
jgi:hypothetical protein